MSAQLEQELSAAWKRIDDRIAAMRIRHARKGDLPLYETYENPPASEADIKQLEAAIGMPVPFEIQYSWKKWNGRWIAPDHEIALSDVQSCLTLVQATPPLEPRNLLKWESVVGPINPLMDSARRFVFGSHQIIGASLFLDYEDPPPGGRLGQVIRSGQEPIAQFVAGSFVEFLKLVADAPVHDDDPDFDPLSWPR